MRILIADDDRTSTLMLGRTLEQWGFEVVVEHDGIAAWKQIEGDQPPALAIVDWMMPGLDGIELCRRIRATPPRSPVYVILLTARSSRQDLVAGLQAGAERGMGLAHFVGCCVRADHTDDGAVLAHQLPRIDLDAAARALADDADFCAEEELEAIFGRARVDVYRFGGRRFARWRAALDELFHQRLGLAN